MIEDSQINVYMAGNTTLFITNYPESADDESMRALFEPVSACWQVAVYRAILITVLVHSTGRS